ncbi:MAG: MGDG synthase family glycosyltransferase, partial [Christensenellales bacterium]
YIEREQPDILLTSHIFAAQALTHLKHQHSDLPPTIGIMTDYTCAPFWEETELDAYITPHPLLDGEFTKKLMPAEKLHALGIPVAPACTPCGDSAPAKLAQGLDTGRAHLLVIGGSMGAGNLPEVVLSLQGVDALISVVCGNNKALFNQLSQRYAGDENVRILGYVSPMFPLMDSADIILSKSGGLTSTEIMTKRKPFIVINPIEGVETRNAEFFEQLGAAMYARTDADIRADVQRLLKDNALRADMRAAQERNIDSNASGRIAEFALAMANKE